MNLIQRIKAAFIPSQGSDAGNKYNQSLFSYFNGIFFNIPNNPRDASTTWLLFVAQI